MIAWLRGNAEILWVSHLRSVYHFAFVTAVRSFTYLECLFSQVVRTAAHSVSWTIWFSCTFKFGITSLSFHRNAAVRSAPPECNSSQWQDISNLCGPYLQLFCVMYSSVMICNSQLRTALFYEISSSKRKIPHTWIVWMMVWSKLSLTVFSRPTFC